MNEVIDRLESKLDFPDLGKLVLRVSFSIMLLLHGVHKIYGGTEFIQGLFINIGLPGFFAYAVYIGEVVAPILVALGVYTRLAATFLIGTCIVIIGLMFPDSLFTLNKFGAWAAEGVGTYLFASIAILLLGPGKYALRPEIK